MQYVAYYRVSTTKQGIHGLGIDAQKHAVQQFIKGNGGTIVKSFQEVESGRKMKHRPEAIKALRHCRLTGATLLIAKMDRLSRNAVFLMTLQESEIDFIACDNPSANKLTVGMMAVMAEHESEVISERTKAAMAAAKRRGQTFGNPILHLVRNTDTAEARAEHVRKAGERNLQVRQLIDELEAEYGSDMTLRELADSLNAAGYKTARGSRFTPTQVSRIKKQAAVG